MNERIVQTDLNLKEQLDPVHPLLLSVLEKDLFFQISHCPTIGINKGDLYAVQKQYHFPHQTFLVVCFYAFNEAILQIVKIHVEIKIPKEHA